MWRSTGNGAIQGKNSSIIFGNFAEGGTAGSENELSFGRKLIFATPMRRKTHAG